MNKFLKVYDLYEINKYEFENDSKEKKSYISRQHNWLFDDDNDIAYLYTFHCCDCNESYDLKDLTFMNQKIVCKCGSQFSANELRPKICNYKNQSYIEHNLNNGTFNKVSVPTLINHNFLYCDKCKTTHKVSDMPVENKQRVCSCGASYSYEDLKLTRGDEHDHMNGAIYFDNNKISISYLTYFSSVNHLDNYYWQEGNKRVTMNLETGYSYLSNTGICYTHFNKIYKERTGKNAPKMLNSTYMTYANLILDSVVLAKISKLYIKYKDNKNLVKLIQRRYSKLEKIYLNEILETIDKYMTDYYNNKYCYRIKSLKELIEEESTDRRKHYGINIYDTSILSLRNRFINASYKELKYLIPDILYNMQFASKKRNYKVLPRESNNISLDYICNSSLISKKLRKKINADLIETYSNLPKFSSIRFKTEFQTFINLTKHFKNKENINKVYMTLTSKNNRKKSYRCTHTDLSDATMKLWLTYRNETYISNCNYTDIDNKARLMEDSRRLISHIKNVYGEDWDLNSVKFHNEKQFHDELMRITNSDDFIEELNRRKNKEALKPFEMEEEVFELEEQENDFYIAKNRAILTNIGQAMGICVGGYGGKVESGLCRIAYLKENGLYKACIELKKSKDSKTKKMKYTMIQAKMQYNKLVAEDEFYYNKVLEWATRNNIEICTHDMCINSNNGLAEMGF